MLLAWPLLAATPDTTVTLRRPLVGHDRMRRAGDGERFRCVYGTRDPATAPTLRAAAVALVVGLFGGDTTEAMADRDATGADLAAGPVLLVGGPRENAWTARLAAALPVHFDARGFEWFATRYDRPGDAVTLAYPNPLAPWHYLVLVAGNTAAAITRSGGMLFGDEDWRIERDGELARTGRFADTPRPWSYDPALDHDRERDRARFETGLTSGPASRFGLTVRAGADQAAWRARVQSLAEAVLGRAARFAPGHTPVVLTLYPTLEEKGALTRDTRPEHLDRRGAPHLAPASGRDTPDLWSVAAARLRPVGAGPASRFLEPAGVWCAGRFGGERLEAAVSRLYFGRLWPRARDAATRPMHWRSPLIAIPARAVLFAAIADVAGSAAPLLPGALLAGDPPGELDSLCARVRVDPARVERRYAALGDSLARAGQRAARARPPRAWRPADGFQRGVCLTHAPRLEQGYLSRACARQLDTLRAMGAEWISLTAHGVLTSDDSPEIRPGADAGPEGESDEAVAEAAARAHARGLKVWLVPRLWTRGWVGDLRYTPSGWTAFFERYRELLLHEALLAERERIEGLMVGDELASATAADPGRWRALIGEVRRVYDGTLCYAASGADEASRIDFWDALDLVGVSFREPLATSPTVDTRTLREGAHRALATLRPVATRWRRPVLLTAAGYPAVVTAAVRPWDETGDPDPEAQRACLEALVAALEPDTWIAGVHWWMWSSADRSGGPLDPGFTPRGKPAEAVLRGSLAAWAERPVTIPAPR
ncbi:MAG TPA: hypothetical protein VLV15_10740 [Dongiaceae bacterium]|nr:hypothetical protein [Dongiaceae bacterium]